MAWSRTVRTTFLAVLGIEIAAWVFLLQANRHRDKLAELRFLADSIRGRPVMRGVPADSAAGKRPEIIQHLGDYYGFVKSLYFRQPEWNGVSDSRSNSALRRRMAILYGMDMEALETAALPPSDTTVLAAEWSRFERGWLRELVTLSQSLHAYLDSSTVENMLRAHTLEAGRFQQLPFILPRLRRLSISLDSALSRPTSEYHVFYRLMKDQIDTTHLFLSNLHGLLLAADGIAYAEGQLVRQGVLAYGPGHFLAPQIVRAEPTTIIGIPVPVNTRGRWIATILVCLVAGTYVQVLLRGWEETFNQRDGEKWFLLAFHPLARAVIAVALPALGLLAVIILAWK